MRKIFTLLCVALLATGLFAATEPAWYNDVTSITANGQYYIYSVNGAGFMQAGNEQVKAINQNNYSTTSGLVFKIVSPSGGNVYSGNYYLYSYQASLTSACGPVYSNGSDKGTKIVWTLMENGAFWNIHSLYEFMGNRYAALYYTGEKYDAVVKDKNPISQNRKDTYTDIEYQWYVISPAHYDRHWAIYLYDRYKETISDYTKWENLVPAAYYTALTNAYAVTYNVKNTEHSKEVVNEHRADLKALYDNAAAVADAYANAKTVINALEAIEDKGEDFAEVTEGISNARTAIEQAMSVEALNAAVSAPALKAVDPITFNVTEFEAPNFVTNAASTVAGRAITYNAENKAIINAEGKAIHVGKTKLTATAAATDAYYKFVRSAEVTVTAPATYGTFEQTTCDESVTFFGKEYTESTKEDVKVGENWMGGDSIVRVNITINHATFSEESLTITYGDRASWNGAALSDSTVGVHTMVYVTTNAAGCDSTVTLTLTVNKMATLEVPETLEFCVGGSETYRGVEYTEAGTYEIPAEGEIRDTLYTVKVAVNPVYSFSETGKAKVGEGYTWQGTNYETPATGTFKYEAPYTTVNGCDSIYYLTLTVTKADVVEVPVALSFCAGGSETFRGVEYTEANTYNVSAEGDIRDTLYIVNVTVLQPSYSTDTKTITFGDDAEWNGIALSDSTVGVHTVIYETTNAAGCDSTVTLTLTVNKMEDFLAEKELAFCEGDSVEYHGSWYFEEGEDEITIPGATRDTTITIYITVHEKSYTTDTKTITFGDEAEWNGIALSDSTVGVHYVVYETTNAAGCDSTVTLTLTVEKMSAFEAEKELEFCEGDSVEYRGVWYSTAGEYPVLVEDDVRDTLINVIVTVHEKAYAELERTVLAGNVLTLPEGEWTIGDQVVIGTYETLRGDTLGLELYQYDETEFGCESVVKLIVTVTPNYEAIETVSVGEQAEKFFQNGAIYIRRGEKKYSVEGRLLK